MKNQSTLAAFLAMLLMLTFGCKKQKDTAQPGKTATYDFEYAGTMREGEPIQFAVKSQDTSQFLWDFGDGTTAPHVYATHTYAHSGVYNVSVTVNGDVAHKSSKAVTVNPNTFSAYLASGMKTWHGHYTESSASHNSSYGLPDSSFTVTYVDSLHVGVYKTILSYGKNNYADSLSIFTRSIDALTSYTLTYNKKSGATTFEITLSPPDAYIATVYTTP